VYSRSGYCNTDAYMTRYTNRKTKDRLHCTFSAIIDIFEMENNREPSSQEVNDIIITIGDCAAMAK
jgi:hypothetical protein